MPNPAPRLVVIAGPNGAGKSTLSRSIVHDHYGIGDFVNADAIALGLSAFDPERAAVAAGRVMLSRLQALADVQADFAFETTLASRSFAPWIAELRRRGYVFHLVFVALPSAEVAIARVRNRVASGGHSIPEDIVRRRHARGLRNFFELYRPLADEWMFFDNSGDRRPRMLSRGGIHMETSALDPEAWRKYAAPPDIARERPSIEPVISTEAMNRAAGRAVREALLRHKLLGQSIVVVRDGRVVEIPPEQIEIGELDD